LPKFSIGVSWEAVRHYSKDLVVEAASVIEAERIVDESGFTYLVDLAAEKSGESNQDIDYDSITLGEVKEIDDDDESEVDLIDDIEGVDLVAKV
jgi:hypothetical protein